MYLYICLVINQSINQLARMPAIGKSITLLSSQVDYRGKPFSFTSNSRYLHRYLSITQFGVSHEGQQIDFVVLTAITKQKINKA
jgi:hypothetical protein